jgi:hypothetical protein
MISNQDLDIIFELYKLSSVVIPEKNTWSLDELLERFIIESETTDKSEIVDRLKQILNELEQKQAIIYVNGFQAFNLVEPKLLELVNVSKSNKKSRT